ncbi:hypothetical protein [Geoalkalibacter sp.]|uniref:hypothetical protein n=1 Tax=Geoalkalibacter sp. TaxID=3041440 RepID=UPI00272E6EE4|nr:hypothetical protein [Geoalkalibacter sp.]
MKTTFVFAVIFAAATAFAQQPPDLRDTQPPANPQAERKSQPPPPVAPPTVPKQVPGDASITNAQLLELLQAQTAAIKALHEKIGELEQRVERIEEGLP